MPDAQALQELVRQVRGDTLRVLDASKATWLTWAPEGTSNHILWHAGHALWLLDRMGIELLSGQSELPPGWTAMFGMESHPQSTSRWPDPSEVRALLQSQLERMLTLLGETSDDVLRKSPDTLGAKRTTVGWIIHGLHDEAKHSGEMYLLWKLCRGNEASK